MTREVDGGLQTVELKMPAIVTADLRLNQPRYASLPNIMKAKKKPLDEKSPADYGADVKPRLKVLKTEEPSGRKAGVKVKSVAELVDKLKNEAGVLVRRSGKGYKKMAILLIAEHDNASAFRPDRQGAVGGAEDRLGRACAGRRQGRQGRRRRRRQAEGRDARCCWPRPTNWPSASPSRLAALVVSLAGAYDTIIAPATTSGKNVTPRVAALLDVAQVSEIIEVVSPDTFKRPIYAGNAIQTVQSTDAKKVITVRTASFQAAPEGGSAAVETVKAAANPGLSTFVENRLSESDRPELTSAKIIISGGRALGSAEKFQEVILPVADKLGAAVGASPRRGRCRLCAERLAGRPDRQGRRARPLHRGRHLRRHPAPRRHEGFEGHRRHQQGRGGADLPGRRLRPRRRSLRHPAGAAKGALTLSAKAY